MPRSRGSPTVELLPALESLRPLLNTFRHCPHCAHAIPTAIVCTRTENCGKVFQAHDPCKYFKWLSDDDLRDQMEAVLRYALQLSALPAASASSQPPPPPSPPTLLGSSQPAPPTALDGKRACAISRCHRTCLSTRCVRAMCKKCCVTAGGCSVHLSSTPRPDLSALGISLPTPAATPTIPPVTTVAPFIPSPSPAAEAPAPVTSDSTPADVCEKTYRKSAGLEWSHDRDIKLQKIEARQKAEQQKRENERRLAREVVLWWWSADGEDPTLHRIQDVPTWPTLNLAHCPELLEELCLTPQSRIQMYSTDFLAWATEGVDRAIEINTNKPRIFLIRAVGVRKCLDLNCKLESLNPKKQTVKRPREGDDPNFPEARRGPRLMPEQTQPASSFVSSQPSPSLTVSSRSISSLPPSPQFLTPAVSEVVPASSVHTPALSRSPSLEIDETEMIHVHQPLPTGKDGKPKAWPTFMYAQDMAQLFRLMGDTQQPERRWAEIMPPCCPYKKATYYQQRAIWRNATQDKRDEALELPRTSDGLWTVWRSSPSSLGSTMTASRSTSRLPSQSPNALPMIKLEPDSIPIDPHLLSPEIIVIEDD